MNNHICRICNKEFQSIRYFVKTCSQKCYRYTRTKKHIKGIKINEKKQVMRPLRRSFTYDKENFDVLKSFKE